MQVGEAHVGRGPRVDTPAERVDEALGDHAPGALGDEVEQRRLGPVVVAERERGKVPLRRGARGGIRPDERHDVVRERIGGDAEHGAAGQRRPHDGARLARDGEVRAAGARSDEIEVEGGVGDERGHGVGAGRERLGAEVEINFAHAPAPEEPADRVRRFADDHPETGAGEVVSEGETGDPGADDRDVGILRSRRGGLDRGHRARQSCTVRTRSVSTSGSVSMGTP